MKNEAHIVYSETPLPENVNHIAQCGKVIHRAKLAFLWDEQEMGQPINFGGRNVCRECYYAVMPAGTSMVYGFKEGKAENADEFEA